MREKVLKNRKEVLDREGVRAKKKRAEKVKEGLHEPSGLVEDCREVGNGGAVNIIGNERKGS